MCVRVLCVGVFFTHYLLNLVIYTGPIDPDPPTSVLLTNIGTTSATVTWTAPSQQSNNRIVSFVLILADLKFGFPSINITVSSTTLSYTITGLEEFGSYGCDVLSVGEFGFFSTAISTTINTLASGKVKSINFSNLL